MDFNSYIDLFYNLGKNERLGSVSKLENVAELQKDEIESGNV